MREKDDIKAVEKAKLKIVGRTRCWKCYTPIEWNELEDPDVKIAIHCVKVHSIPLPSWAKEILDRKKPRRK